MTRLRDTYAPTRALVGTFLLLFFAFAYIHQGHYRTAATPVSRLDLLHALFVHGTLRIDAYVQNTTDRAVYEGHYFSDKAPGTVALALPAFGAAAIILQAADVPLDSDSGWLFSSWAATAGSNALLAALGGSLLFAWLSHWVSPCWALVTTLALFLGAAPLPYATMMHSHAATVGLIAIALWTIEHQTDKDARRNRIPTLPLPHALSVQTRGPLRGSLSAHGWDALGGLACGWVLASEYTAGIVVTGVLVWLISLQWQRAIPFCLAALPPLLLIPAYSWACFGDPFILPYSRSDMFPPMKEGLYAIKWPDLNTVYHLLFTPKRGLLFWTPFLVMAGFGYRRLWQTDRRLFWLTSAVPLLQVIVISGRTFDWEAGPALGPRYLSPMLPLLALPCALGLQRFSKLGIALATYSVLITTLATLTDACPIGITPNPLIEHHIPLLRNGQFSPNLGMVLGLPPYLSVALYYLLLMGGSWWLWTHGASPKRE